MPFVIVLSTAVSLKWWK